MTSPSRRLFQSKSHPAEDGVRTYLFPFPFSGDVLRGLRWRLLLLGGWVHDDRGSLHRRGELWLGRVVGPWCGSNTNNGVNRQIVQELDQTCDTSQRTQ